MSALKTQILTDTWVSMDWDEYLGHLEDPQLKKAKAYYYQGHGRFEMLPVGFSHGKDHVTVTYAINLFCAIKALPLCMVDSTTLRKVDIDDCQPDLAIWIGPDVRSIPSETGIVDLNRYPTPNMVIEVSNTSLLDDLGTKRSLYESLNVSEYWIVDVKKGDVLAFEMLTKDSLNKGSQRIDTSKVLPGFDIATMAEALRRSRETDQSQMGAWLLKEFQQQ